MKTLWILRTFLVLHAVAVAAQPVLAGSYLSGQYDALAGHELNAFVVQGLCVFSLFAAVAYWLIGRGRGWPALMLLLVEVVEQVQAGFGYERLLAWHIPLGVAIVLVAIWLAAWSFTARARRTRPPRRRRAAKRAPVLEEVPA